VYEMSCYGVAAYKDSWLLVCNVVWFGKLAVTALRGIFPEDRDIDFVQCNMMVPV